MQKDIRTQTNKLLLFMQEKTRKKTLFGLTVFASNNELYRL